MSRGPKKRILEVSPEQRRKMEELVSSRNTAAAVARRARIILEYISGKTNKSIASELNINITTIRRLRDRFCAKGISALYDVQRAGCKKDELLLSDEELAQLKSWVHSKSLPAKFAERSKIILQAAEGLLNVEIARNLSIHATTVAKWRKRFIKDRLEGLHDEYRPGPPRKYSEERVAGLIKDALECKPKGETHWSCRTFAKKHNISHSTVSRIWNLFGIQPHRTKGFKLSTDPFFVDKVKDVVGLYLSPPTNAVVLCVDEKSQCQALERAQPILPMGGILKE